jgi:hypothetical protein
MPRRSNKFQRLVALIHGCLGDSARVDESAMLPDKVTGELREVDVLIASTVSSTYSIAIAIEVMGRERKADSPWVESMRGKHADLPIDKVVLVSERGFTRPAAEKAKRYGMEPVTIDAALHTDWGLAMRLTERR